MLHACRRCRFVFFVCLQYVSSLFLLTVLQVTWYVPVADETGCRSRQPRLTKVSRLQRFLTYLVIYSADLPPNSRPAEMQRIHILKAISWSVNIVISVDSSRPLSERVTCIGPAQQTDPEIMDGSDAPSLTENALHPPNANSSQMLIWWPADVNSDPVVVVKPLTTTPSILEAARTYQHAHSRHALRLQSLYNFPRQQ